MGRNMRSASGILSQVVGVLSFHTGSRWSRPDRPEVTFSAILAMAGRAAHLEAVSMHPDEVRRDREKAPWSRLTACPADTITWTLEGTCE